MSNNSVWPIDRTLSSTNTSDQSGPGSNGNEEVLHIPLSSSIIGRGLPLCRDAVGVFYSPIRLSWKGLKYCYLTLIILFDISPFFFTQDRDWLTWVKLYERLALVYVAGQPFPCLWYCPRYEVRGTIQLGPCVITGLARMRMKTASHYLRDSISWFLIQS